MVKIFVIDGLRRAGAQVVTISLCERLAESGEDVIVITYRDYDEIILSKKITHIKLSLFGLSRQNNLDTVERVVSRILGKLWCILFSYYASNKLKQRLKRVDGEIEIYLVSDAAFSWFFRIANVYKTTVIFHSVKSVQYSRHILNYFFARLFLKQVVRRASVFAISRLIKDDLIDAYRLNGNRIKLVGNYLDKTKIITLSEKPVEIVSDKNYFVYVGRLSEEKMVTEIIDAFKLFLTSTKLEYDLIIIGDGPLWEKVRHKIESYNLNNNIKMLGKIDNPYPYIKQSSGLILNSLREGLPTVLIEANILGVPFVSSRCFDELSDLSCLPYEKTTFQVGDSRGLCSAIKFLSDQNIEVRKDFTDYLDDVIHDY